MLEIDKEYSEWIVDLYKLFTNQDFKQKTNMVISVSLEMYRVMVSSLLILFVPQKCGDHVCSMFENLNAGGSKFYRTCLIMNYVTVACFVIMYIAEIRREEKLIKLLEVNNTISTDNESVGRRIEQLPEYKKEQIFYIDIQYMYSSYLAMAVFMANTTMSSIIIYQYSLGNQTLINLTTNILFMISKLTNVFGIIYTDKNIFFSAYLNTKVQFNDLDPREIEKLHNIELEKRRSLEEAGMKINRIKLLETGGFVLIDSDSSNE